MTRDGGHTYAACNCVTQGGISVQQQPLSMHRTDHAAIAVHGICHLYNGNVMTHHSLPSTYGLSHDADGILLEPCMPFRSSQQMHQHQLYNDDSGHMIHNGTHRMGQLYLPFEWCYLGHLWRSESHNMLRCLFTIETIYICLYHGCEDIWRRWLILNPSSAHYSSSTKWYYRW